MKKTQLLFAVAVSATVFALSVSALEKSKSDEAKGGEAKTVAWYVANPRDARAKNKECYGNPKATELQATPDCVNSLQALQMSHVGAN